METQFEQVNPVEYPFGMRASDVIPGATYIAVPIACDECLRAEYIQDGHFACAFARAPEGYMPVAQLGPVMIGRGRDTQWVELFYYVIPRNELHYHPISPIGGGKKTGYWLGPNAEIIMKEAEWLESGLRANSVDLEDAQRHMLYLLEVKDFSRFWTYCDLTATNPPVRHRRSLRHYRALQTLLREAHQLSRVAHDLHDFARVIGWAIRLASSPRWESETGGQTQ